MATLLNIHLQKEPTVPVIPKITMATLGLLTRAVNLSSVVNRDNMEPDVYNNAAYDANKDIVVGIANRIVRGCDASNRHPVNIEGQ